MILPKPLPKIIKVKLDLKDSGGYAGPIEYLLRQQLLIQSEKLADDHGDYAAANKIRRTHDTSLMKVRSSVSCSVLTFAGVVVVGWCLSGALCGCGCL